VSGESGSRGSGGKKGRTNEQGNAIATHESRFLDTGDDRLILGTLCPKFDASQQSAKVFILHMSMARSG
jgi:hypothetical protein